MKLIKRLAKLHPAALVLVLALSTLSVAALTSHSEALLDALILALDTDADGDFTDEGWYTALQSKPSEGAFVDGDKTALDNAQPTLAEGAFVDGDKTKLDALELLSTVSQAEAEAGTATDNRAWTAERVSQAIAALESVSTVLGKTGDVVKLNQAPTPFADGDTTPDVSSQTVYETANTSATTITDFDGTPSDGDWIIVLISDVYTTFDFTSSGLESAMGTDYSPTRGAVAFFYSTADNQWHAESGAFDSFNLQFVTEIEFEGDNEDTYEKRFSVDEPVVDSTLKLDGFVFEKKILEPDTAQGVSDTIEIMHVLEERYPNGIKIESIHITTSATCTDSLNFEEHSNDGTTWSVDGTVEAITLSGVHTEDDGTLTDNIIAADAYLFVDLDDTPTDISWMLITVEGRIQ